MDPFRTLGLPAHFRLDPSEIERAYRGLQRALHPDRHASGTPAERRASLARAIEVNDAYRTLRDDLARAEALLRLRTGAGTDGNAADPALLMEMMELREDLASLRARNDTSGILALRGRVKGSWGVALEALTSALDAAPASSADSLARATTELVRLRYLRRLLDEIDADEAR